ncbi:MAG TPA: pyridoxamine 5'-phosphate oxidase family protein [Solirubrobacterales bacterium]|jgi:nitroimidazol reductase NimA-like FMN-containing flavoprotein (pyridoxamine 5'-phosphate oxidase superfamily)|nr:pyridoxamine 5'-phosphate oxidase family protein [Solirubrobacterales bacterium]
MARRIIDANRYMTVATANRSGRPWASPVYYAAVGYTQFLWVSDRDARHSRNLADRPELGIVIASASLRRTA